MYYKHMKSKERLLRLSLGASQLSGKALILLLACLSPRFASAATTSWYNHRLFDVTATTTLDQAVAQAFKRSGPVLYALCVVMIIIGGFMYITSGGDSSKASRGKEFIVAALTGALLFSLAYGIIRAAGGSFTIL